MKAPLQFVAELAAELQRVAGLSDAEMATHSADGEALAHGQAQSAEARLSSLNGRLSNREGWAAPNSFDRWRDERQPWRAWYKATRWQKLRWSILVRDHFTCRMCKRLFGDTKQLVCDHIEPHDGNAQKFRNDPFQTLCKDCHDSEKQREEQDHRASRRADGPGFV